MHVPQDQLLQERLWRGLTLLPLQAKPFECKFNVPSGCEPREQGETLKDDSNARVWPLDPSPIDMNGSIRWLCEASNGIQKG